MPKISERQKALDEAEEAFMLAVINSDSDMEEDALLCFAFIAESPYLGRPERRKRDDYFFTTKFYALTNDEFRLYFRRFGFSVIARKIEQHPVFHNNSNYSPNAFCLAIGHRSPTTRTLREHFTGTKT
ncbi:hypothetical protein BGZ65_009432, partial [Modicella reniformis]